MAKQIYVVDERTSHCFSNGKMITKAGDANCMLLKVKEKDAMTNIVSRILSHVESTGVDVLRIMGHGYETDMRGLPAVNGGGPGMGHGQLGSEGLNVNMVPKFAPLKGKFARGGQVEIHSCKLADPSCTVGVEGSVRCSNWLQGLADALGIKVIAAEKLQYADASWVFEGPTITYQPK